MSLMFDKKLHRDLKFVWPLHIFHTPINILMKKRLDLFLKYLSKTSQIILQIHLWNQFLNIFHKNMILQSKNGGKYDKRFREIVSSNYTFFFANSKKWFHKFLKALLTVFPNRTLLGYSWPEVNKPEISNILSNQIKPSHFKYTFSASFEFLPHLAISWW